MCLYFVNVVCDCVSYLAYVNECVFLLRLVCVLLNVCGHNSVCVNCLCMCHRKVDCQLTSSLAQTELTPPAN